MNDLSGFSDPMRSLPLCQRDGFARCCKGGMSNAAIKEQRAAREQSAAQFAESMALQQKQFDAAQKIKPMAFLPAAPLATGDKDNYMAGLDARRQQSRRYGPARTRLASAPQTSAIPMGAAPSMAA